MQPASRYKKRMDIKTCFRCREALPLTEFYRHTQTKDKLLNECKACVKARVSKNYHARSKQYSAYRAAYQKTAAGKAVHLRAMNKYRRTNNEKARARDAVYRALASGVLVKTNCVHCGATDRIHGHHRDYSKPLDVVWCCYRCHVVVEHKKKWRGAHKTKV
jgi:hypothetical protein